jgi:UDP-N-acetyl-2-amino-2-deoxyglucuronate dehydrogenase
MSGKIGFGIIGAGVISHVHAQAIAEITDAELIGVFNVNLEKGAAFSLRHGCNLFHTLEDMLAHPGLDVVCICTPSGAHLEPALAAIRAGKHCLIEKPLEITLERCDAIIEAASKAGVLVGVIFPSRFYDAAQKLKQAMDAGRFGDIVIGDAYVKWHRTAAYYQSSAWRGTWKLDGGGALMNQGIHSVDLLQWYMGPVETVQAFIANRKHKDIQVEDTVVASLRFANGALGSIEASTALWPGSLKQIEILGTEGSAVLQESDLTRWDFIHPASEDDDIRDASHGSASHGGVSNPADISHLGHLYQISDLIRTIRHGGVPSIDGIEGRKSVEIVLAIYQSAREGRPVHLLK